MKLMPKDMVGIAVAIFTGGLILVHNGPWGHPEGHDTPVVDGGGAVTSAAEEPTWAFTDFNVIPMNREGVVRRQTVIVSGGVVQRIGPVGVVEPPDGARIIPGDGRAYLVPGLTDAHVHLPEGAETWLPLFIANGVTTVFNLEGAPRHLELRERIETENLPAPTVYTSGPFIDETELRTAEVAIESVRRQAALGYDFIKIHGELREDVYEVLSAAAKAEHIPVVGHAPRNLPFSEVLENGQAGVVHAEELIYTQFMTLRLDEVPPVAEAMAAVGTWLTPTLSTFENILAQWGAPDRAGSSISGDAAGHVPEHIRDAWARENPYVSADPESRPRIAAMLDFQGPLVRALHEAGVPMLTGTDTPVPAMVPGFSLHDELSALRDAGLSTSEVLSAATANGGRFIRENVDADAAFGTIELGARADLVVLDQNPLQDLDRLRRPQGVMVRGRWFSRADLDRLLSPPRVAEDMNR